MQSVLQDADAVCRTLCRTLLRFVTCRDRREPRGCDSLTRTMTRTYPEALGFLRACRLCAIEGPPPIPAELARRMPASFELCRRGSLAEPLREWDREEAAACRPTASSAASTAASAASGVVGSSILVDVIRPCSPLIMSVVGGPPPPPQDASAGGAPWCGEPVEDQC
jgi:hypothetical protein